MAKQYNVNIIGNLTNTNGVLSGFSSGNYATLSKTFNPSAQTALEIVFKFNSNNISDEQVIFQMGNISTADGYIDIEIYNSKLYFEFASENTQRCYIEGITSLSSNTDYWAKLTYNGVNIYTLSLSADGTTWSTEGTANSWYYLMNVQNSYIGINQDLSRWYFSGGIDLNESYIKVNGAMWWRGAENITKIQLRHDTAANWTSVNPVLSEGEVGIETDTRKQKFGDGTTAWNSLSYDMGSTALQSNTTVIDGQWVSSQTTLANSVSCPTGTADEYSLSTYLPNDNYNYEVQFCIIGVTGSTLGARLVVTAGSSILTHYPRVLENNCVVNGKTLNSACSFTIPIGTNRKIYINGIAASTGSYTLYAQSYRRIGTNS